RLVLGGSETAFARPRRKPVSFYLGQPAAVDLAGADDVKAHGIEADQIGMGQDEDDVVQVQHLPLMQSDQDVAALNAGFARDAIRADFGDVEAAVKLLVDPGNQFGADG